jgi:hypothetical protein
MFGFQNHGVSRSYKVSGDMFVPVNRSARKWTVKPFTMWRADKGDHLGGAVSPNDRVRKRRIDGARIFDADRDLIYEAVIERANGRARLTGITILTTQPGQRIDQDTIRRVPVQRIAEQVSLHLAEAESSDLSAIFTTEPVRNAPVGRFLEEVARDHRSGLSRNAIAAKWHVSVYTVDKRLREARDRKLIEPPTTGRPRRVTPRGEDRTIPNPQVSGNNPGQSTDTTKGK